MCFRCTVFRSASLCTVLLAVLIGVPPNCIFVVYSARSLVVLSSRGAYQTNMFICDRG